MTQSQSAQRDGETQQPTTTNEGKEGDTKQQENKIERKYTHTPRMFVSFSNLSSSSFPLFCLSFVSFARSIEWAQLSAECPLMVAGPSPSAVTESTPIDIRHTYEHGVPSNTTDGTKRDGDTATPVTVAAANSARTERNRQQRPSREENKNPFDPPSLTHLSPSPCPHVSLCC